MAFDSKGLDDYIDVARRIAEFRTKHPEGSLQPLNPAQPFEIRELAGTGKDGKEVRATFIIYTAAAYRSPDDPRPGAGCAYEVFPGRTPYTAGSELQNAETAAWGRAIVAALAADTRAGIASQQEVRNRQAAGDMFENAAPARPQPANGNERAPRGHLPEPAPDTDQEWLGDALTAAANFTTVDFGRELWRKAAAKHKDGACTIEDRKRIEALITARLEEIRQPLQTASGQAPGLDPDDPWAAKVETLTSADDVETTLDEVIGEFKAGRIDETRANVLRNAIRARGEQIAAGLAQHEEVPT